MMTSIQRNNETAKPYLENEPTCLKDVPLR